MTEQTEAERLLEVITGDDDPDEREEARQVFYDTYTNQGCIDGDSVRAVPALIAAIPRMPGPELWWIPSTLSDIATAHHPEDPDLHRAARDAVRAGLPLYIDLLWHEAPEVTDAAAELLSAFPEEREVLPHLLAAVEHDCDPVSSAKLLSYAVRDRSRDPELAALLRRCLREGAPLEGVAALALVERWPGAPELDDWLRRIPPSLTHADGLDHDAVARAVASLDPSRVVEAFVPAMMDQADLGRASGELLLWLVSRDRLGRPPASTDLPVFRFRDPVIRYPEPAWYRWTPTEPQRAMLAATPERFANCGPGVEPDTVSDLEVRALEVIATGDTCWRSPWQAPPLYGFPAGRSAFAAFVEKARRRR